MLALDSRDLALAEVELAVVLVEDDHAAERLAPVGREQERRKCSRLSSPRYSMRSRSKPSKASTSPANIDMHGLCKPEAFPKDRGDVIHGSR